MFERFTEKAIKVIMLAQEEARRLGHNFVGTEQILLGLIGEGTGVAAKVLENLNVSLKDARIEVEKIIGRGSGFVSVEIPFTPRANHVLELSWDEARQLGHNYIGTEHLLLGLLREKEGVAVRVVENLGVDLSSIRSNVIRMLGESTVQVFRSKTPTLDEFSIDLTGMAREERLDPVVGRELEMERIIRILDRRTMSNPLLIGEAGTGKTAIIQGLAACIGAGEVPEFLQDKRIASLDIRWIIAGTQSRGQLEELFRIILEEIRGSGNIILAIEDLHNWVGAGTARGSLDAVNIIKPALAGGELQCIATTTPDGYEEYIRRDGVLERRFQPVPVGEPSVEETIEILRGLRERYEAHHHLHISDDALEASAQLSARHIPTRFRPGKAIDLLDEAASYVRLGSSLLPPAAKEKEKELRAITKKKEEAIRQQDFELASKLRGEEQMLRDQIREVTEHWQEERGVPVVDAHAVATTVSDWTGIPVEKLTAELGEKSPEAEGPTAEDN